MFLYFVHPGDVVAVNTSWGCFSFALGASEVTSPTSVFTLWKNQLLISFNCWREVYSENNRWNFIGMCSYILYILGMLYNKSFRSVSMHHFRRNLFQGLKVNAFVYSFRSVSTHYFRRNLFQGLKPHAFVFCSGNRKLYVHLPHYKI